MVCWFLCVLQEIMMDHALRTISYIADIGDVLVVMARRGPVDTSPSDNRNRDAYSHSQTKICCHVFESDEVSWVNAEAYIYLTGDKFFFEFWLSIF